jgi:hypothetical protein
MEEEEVEGKRVHAVEDEFSYGLLYIYIYIYIYARTARTPFSIFLEPLHADIILCIF